jgi:adenosylcobinamide-GDP ribazoletransferase
VNSLLAALALLTIFPIRRALDFSAHAFSFFPIIGAFIGLVLTLAFLVFRFIFPPIVAAALTVALWAFLTGGLHLDGVSDAFDGLFAAVSRERRLEILRDVHMGAFGAVGLVLVLLIKFAALNQINPIALFLAPVLARWAMVYAAAFPLARDQGMAALFAKGLSRREITIATAITFICVLFFGWLAAGGWLVAVVCATLIARFALSRLGGMTGDIYGLVCEGVEVTVLLFVSTTHLPLL